MRTRPERVEPEIYFRIVHLAHDAKNEVRASIYREQTVEIALGPKGEFKNGNIGALTRRVPTDGVVAPQGSHRLRIGTACRSSPKERLESPS